MTPNHIKVTGLRVRAVQLQLAQPLETASGSYAAWPVLLVDLRTDAGFVGHSFVGCFLPMLVKPLVALLEEMGRFIEGDSLSPLELDRKLRARNRLIGTQGPLATAVTLVEIAAWDALAKASRLPLARLLGAAPRAIPVYKTLIAMDPGKAAELAHEAVEAGYGGVKCKLGNPDPAKDLVLVEAVRKACGAGFPIMGDYNQALSVPDAMQRIRPLDELGLVWIEEPTEASDFAGHARIAQAAHTPISIGENWRSPAEAAASLRAVASDYAMPDLVNIGGVSAWLKTATLAQAHGVPISSHSFPEVCAHLMPACATAHWLEHVDIFDSLFVDPLKPADGKFSASEAPGLGLEWDEATVSRTLIA